MEESAKAIARPAASRSLREAVRKARLEEAEQLDHSADARDGEIARLELLKAELEAVFAEVPANDDRFNLVLVPSRPARLWIDLFTYATDRRAAAPICSCATAKAAGGRSTARRNSSEIADRITRYMAHEIVRRERMEGRWPSPAAPAGLGRARSGAERDGRGDRGLCHRLSSPARRGCSRRSMPQRTLSTRRSLSQTCSGDAATERPIISQMPALARSGDGIFVVARGGDAPLHGFGGRRHADDEGGPGRGLEFVHASARGCGRAAPARRRAASAPG